MARTQKNRDGVALPPNDFNVASGWRLFMTRPLPVLALIASGAIPFVGIVGWAFDMRYSGVIDLQDRQLAEFRERLNVETPRQAEDNIRDLEQRLKLLEGRSLTDEQRAAIRRALALPPGRTEMIELPALTACYDCIKFRDDFAEVITQVPGWTVTPSMSFSVGGAKGGLALMVDDPANPPPGARLLAAALADAKIEFEWVKHARAGLPVWLYVVNPP